MAAQRDSVASLELQAPTLEDSGSGDTVDSHKVPNWKAFFLIFRAFVGIGVLTMPHSVQSFGVIGSGIFFVIFSIAFLYVLDLLLRIAVDLGYSGSRYNTSDEVSKI